MCHVPQGDRGAGRGIAVEEADLSGCHTDAEWALTGQRCVMVFPVGQPWGQEATGGSRMAWWGGHAGLRSLHFLSKVVDHF